MREYNKSYNYFAGLPDEDVVKHQKDDTIGHRPTWFIGVNSWARNRALRATAPGPAASPIASPPTTRSACSPSGHGKAEATSPSGRSSARSGNACASSISRTTATKADIKARFKELVKRLHPDHNQGDRGSEDKLREVIQAYNYLRQAGLA